MNIEVFRDYCLALAYTTESTPFDESTLVFKVGGKMYALVDMDTFEFINLKCDPEKSEELRASYDAIQPGYHMNKKHWNSVYPHRDMKDQDIYELVNHSYDLIWKSLPKKIRKELEDTNLC